MSKVINEPDLYNIINSKKLFWETTYDKQIPKITVKELIPNQAWALENCFTKKECNQFIELGNKIGFNKLKDYHVSYRNNTRFMLSSSSLANELYKRINYYIPETLYNNSWKKDGLNDFFRFCKYEKGRIFGIHQDSSYIQNNNRRSWLTCMLYLNETNGGNTRFFKDNYDKKIICELPPKEGQILLFDPDIWHDGDKVLSGEKYIIRTEVMYLKL